MRKLLTFICTLLVAIGASATINRNLHASVVLEKKNTTENELNFSTVGIRQTIIGEVEMADEPTMEEWNAEYVAKQQKAAAEYAAHDYYFVEGMLHSGCTPQFYGFSMPLIMLPFSQEIVWANYYGPTDWYMQYNDELVAENSETLTYKAGKDYNLAGMYYLPYTTDHTLEQDGETYNIKGYMYAEAKGKGGAAFTTGYTPITISTGENIPMTLCGVETSTMNNENGGDFYRIGAGARGAYAYGTKLIADTATGATADTLLSTVRNVSPLKINAINIPIYNLNGTTMIPKNGEIKIEIFAADLTMGMIYTDSILATAVATIDNFQEVQTGRGTIVATFQEEDKFGGMMDVSIVVEGDFVVQLTGYNESGCDFGIYADYYTPGGTTMYKVGGKYTPIFSKSSNLAIMYDAYWPVAIASLSQEVLVAPVEGGVALDGEYSAFAIYTNVHNFEAWMIDEETSDWLGFSLDDSNLETDGYLIGQITSEALPVGMTGRKGAFVIDVDGYKLSIPVVQGEFVNDGTDITYILNGGVTNDDNWLSKSDMWEAFKVDAGITSLGTLEALQADADPYIKICTPLLDANVNAIMALERWNWLIAYVMEVQNADPTVGQVGGVTALKEGASSAGWRYALAAFFLESQRTVWPKSADFTIAGTLEAFQPAWKHGFANPTKPTNTFVLNAPYKEGARFDGWYATADFSGAKVTKINVTTTGTLYAKWKSISQLASITVRSDDTSKGTVTGGGTYNVDNYAVLRATAKTGYHFSRWNDGNIQNPRIVKVTEDKTYTAYFESISTIAQNDTVYYINFKESMGSWSIDDKVKPEAVSTIWQQTAQYGMKASAFVGGVKHVTESWFMSAPLDLTSCTSLKMEFNQALNYATPDYVSVKITKDGTNWETLTVPNLPTGNNWTFVQSGVIDISSYISDKTQIAFVYTSDDVTAGTWEFDWILLSGDGTRIVEPEKPAEHISLADFVAKADPTTRYEVTATVSKMVDNYYGNFWITDGTHEVYVYGLTYGDQNRNVVDSFNIETGDEITLSGMYLWYTNASGESCVELLNGRFVGVKSANNVPTKADLADYYEPGQLCVCVYFEEEVCNDIVFAGSYNGWDTDPANMAKFAPLEGFNGWYYVAVTDESEEIEGKPVQLKKDGSFSWDYQTGDPASWTIVSGTVNIYAGYDAEADLKGYSTAEPVIMISAYFKNHNTPCIAEVYHDYTIRLSAPFCAGPDGTYYDPAIIGSFNGWAEGVACNDIDEETFDYIFRIYDKEGGEFKFKALGDTDWSNQIQLQNEAGEWYDNPNIKLTAETEIYLDYSAGRFTLCVEQPEQNTYTLTVKSNNSSMGTVSGSGVYEEGENVQISATPHYGYHFSHWNDYNYDNPRQVQVTEDKTYTAYFYKNTYTIFVDYNSTYGTVTGPTSGEYQDEITLTATPNIGYEFVEWSDGVKDNSRTIVLNEDIYLSAYFAQAYSGQCGDNLYWKYDSESQTIAITGSGEMYHYTSSTQPWILFKEQIRKVEISNDVTSLGTSAFEGCRSLGEVHIGLNLLDIYENVFAGCRRLYHIYSYPTYPPFADITSFANYSADVHIPCESYEWYVRDDVWGQFNIKCLGAEAEDVPTGEVTTTTTNTSVTITWPTDEDADTYTIEIKKGDQIFCTLTFSKDGQLTNIAFAPSRDGQHRAQYAEATTKGLRFTVTSLDSGTRYGYDITTKNENEEVIDSYSGEFTTKSDVATDIDNVTATDNTVQKLLRDNQLLILRNGKTYNTMGAEIR